MKIQDYNLWVTQPQPNPAARLRLFCFPYAGSGASVFRTWVSGLPSEVELCPVQLPGRENRLREDPYTTLPSLIEPLEQNLHPFLDIPFAFFGHSLGALISFELARYLRRLHRSLPVYLFVSGHHAPQISDPHPPLCHLLDDQFIEELRRLKGTPEEILRNMDAMQTLLPLLRADFALRETYVYTEEDPLAIPISAFGGTLDERAPQQSLSAWHEQTLSTFTLRAFAGGHFFLHSSRSLLLQAILHDLTISMSTTPGNY